MIFIRKNEICEATKWKLKGNQIIIGDGKFITLNAYVEKLCKTNNEICYISCKELIYNQLKKHSSYIDLRKIEAIDEEVTK